MKATEKVTVLVTGAGAPGIRGTLFALRNHAPLPPLRLLAVDTDPNAIGQHWVDEFRTVPSGASSNFTAALLRICAEVQVSFLIPQTTAELEPLAAAEAQFRAIGTKVLVSPTAAIRTANSKSATARAFRDLGLPAPNFFAVTNFAELSQAAQELGYPARPVVVKLDISNGMRGLRVLRERAWNRARFINEKPDGTEIPIRQLKEILDDGSPWPTLMVSEYLPGPEYSVDAYIGSQSATAIVRSRTRIRSGISFDTQVERHPEMERWSVAVARAVGLRYAVGFQYKLDESGTAKILECNPRVQGTMVASVFSGVNVVGLALEDAITGGRTEEIPEPRPARFLRYWGGIGLLEGAATDEI